MTRQAGQTGGFMGGLSCAASRCVAAGFGCLATSRRGGAGLHARSGRPRRGASRKATLSWYTSTPFPLVQHLADKFTADTGIKVTLLRSGGEAVLRRFLQEYQAGQAGADIITMSDAARPAA